MDDFTMGFLLAILFGSPMFYWILATLSRTRGKYDHWSDEEFQVIRKRGLLIPVAMALFIAWIVLMVTR